MKRYLPLLAILALLGAFAAQAATASAASVAGPAPTLAAHVPVEAEDDEEEGDDFEAADAEAEFDECEAEDFGIEWDDEGEEELTEAEEEELEEECEDAAQKKDGKDSSFVSAPAACGVSRAESTIVTQPAADQVRLTVRYRTWAPTPITVSLKLRDHKGAVGVDRTKARLGDRGVLHLTTKLGSSLMDRTLGASEFDVSLVAPGSPGYCASDLEQRLRSAKHTGADSPRVYSN